MGLKYPEYTGRCDPDVDSILAEYESQMFNEALPLAPEARALSRMSLMCGILAGVRLSGRQRKNISPRELERWERSMDKDAIAIMRGLADGDDAPK